MLESWTPNHFLTNEYRPKPVVPETTLGDLTFQIREMEMILNPTLEIATSENGSPI